MSSRTGKNTALQQHIKSDKCKAAQALTGDGGRIDAHFLHSKEKKFFAF